MRALWRLLLVVAAVILVVFAVSNRANVALGLWPLPAAVELPVYLVVLGGLVFGFIFGEFAAWVAARHWRRELRESQRRIAALERELAAARPPSDPISSP
jgi:uncharacterized integral membrane protein